MKERRKSPVTALSIRKREGRLSSEKVAALNADLAARFGNRFTASQAIRMQHGHTLTWLENQPPDAVVFAESKDDVIDVVKLAPGTTRRSCRSASAPRSRATSTRRTAACPSTARA